MTFWPRYVRSKRRARLTAARTEAEMMRLLIAITLAATVPAMCMAQDNRDERWLRGRLRGWITDVIVGPVEFIECREVVHSGTTSMLMNMPKDGRGIARSPAFSGAGKSYRISVWATAETLPRTWSTRASTGGRPSPAWRVTSLSSPTPSAPAAPSTGGSSPPRSPRPGREEGHRAPGDRRRHRPAQRGDGGALLGALR